MSIDPATNESLPGHTAKNLIELTKLLDEFKLGGSSSYELSIGINEKLKQILSFFKKIKFDESFPAGSSDGKNNNQRMVIFDNNPDKGLIFWYKPNKELLNVLPENISSKLRKEMNILENTTLICETPFDADDAHGCLAFLWWYDQGIENIS